MQNKNIKKVHFLFNWVAINKDVILFNFVMETSDKNRDNELELVRGIYEELFHYYHYYVMTFTGTYLS